MKMILVDTRYDSEDNPIGYEYRVLINNQWYRLHHGTKDIRGQRLKTTPPWNEMPIIGRADVFAIEPEKSMKEPMGLEKDFLERFVKTGENSGIFRQPLSGADLSYWPEYPWGWGPLTFESQFV